MKPKALKLGLLALAVALYGVYLFAPVSRAAIHTIGFTMPGWGLFVFGLELASHADGIMRVVLFAFLLGNILLPLSLFAHKSRYVLISILCGAPVSFLSGLAVFCTSLAEHGFSNSWGGMVWALAMALLGVRAGVLRWRQGGPTQCNGGGMV